MTNTFAFTSVIALMRFFFVVVFSLVHPLVINAQYIELLRPGARWFEPMYCNASDPCYPGSFTSGTVYFTGDDSLFQGEVFKKIMGYPLFVGDSLIPSSPCSYFEYYAESAVFQGLMREDPLTQRVFYYDATEDSVVLLYDFNLVVGDTLHAIAYPDFVVTEIDTISIHGTNRQVFYNEFGILYMEGVGGEFGLFQPLTATLSGCWTTVCLRHNNLNEFGDCIAMLDDRGLEINPIKLFPNPASSELHIELETGKTAELIILDISGHVVYQSPLYSGASTIDISTLEPGYYLCKIDENTRPLLIVH